MSTDGSLKEAIYEIQHEIPPLYMAIEPFGQQRTYFFRRNQSQMDCHRHE
jgi:hypothetical protein